jgi:allantoin racemase
VRLRWQSFVDPDQNRPYLDRLHTYLNEIADPGTEVEVVGVSPPDRWFGRLTELRCATVAVDNAIDADEQGLDAFVYGHFQDSGLFEARSACRLPVVGMGESSLHWAAQLGRTIALVSIDPVFAAWHREQADLYGLGGRIHGVTGLGVRVEDFATAFAGDADAYRRLLDDFRAAVGPLVESGADVVVPAGGLFSLLAAGEQDFCVGHAPVVNSVAVTLKCAEVAVKLRRLSGLGPSRGPSFALAPREAVAEFRAFVAGGRGDEGRPGTSS